MGMGPAPFYVNRIAGFDDCGCPNDGLLHYRNPTPDRHPDEDPDSDVSYCNLWVELADGVAVEMAESVCEVCRTRFQQVYPRAFIPPGTI